MEKWIICDIDGTLLNGKFMSQKTINTLINIQKEGYRLFLASGRSPYTMKYFVDCLELKKYGGIGICFNGGIIYDFKNEKNIMSYTVPPEDVLKCLDYAKQYHLKVAVYSHEKVYCEKFDPKLTPGYYRDDDVYKYVSYIEIDDLSKITADVQKVACVLEESDNYDLFCDEVKKQFIRVHKGWMEKSPNGVNKGVAIQNLMKMFNQVSDNLICFGDGENDIEMFKVCNICVAMDNAFDSLKQHATHITKSNLEDSVAYFIENELKKLIVSD